MSDSKSPYIIVSSSSKTDLEFQVNKKITEGYEPWGGVAVEFASAMMCMFHQALCLRNDMGSIIRSSEITKATENSKESAA